MGDDVKPSQKPPRAERPSSRARTTDATRVYRGSRNLRAVQVLLGHATVATTERYTTVATDEVRAAMVSAEPDNGRPHLTDRDSLNANPLAVTTPGAGPTVDGGLRQAKG